MSMDLREIFKRQKKKNEEAKEKNNKKTPVIIDDDDDDFKTRTKVRTREKGEGREEKRKRVRAILDSDSDGETPKKKVKATPPKKGGKLIKGGKSPAPNVKKEIKKAGDFFGAAPIKRSSYFNKTSTSGQTQEDVVRVSESPTDEQTERDSSIRESESSQLLSSTPTKKLCLVVERVATPPRGTPEKSSGVPEGVTSEKSGPENLKELRQETRLEGSNSPLIKEKESGVRGVTKREISTRSSPRLKRERQVEGEAEGEVGPRAKKNVREHLEKVPLTGDGENSKRPKQKMKANKAIKYLGDSEEEREQAVLTGSGMSGKALGLASPSKRAAASPRKQMTPEREDYLVKQSGLTFDKEKSASPVKKRKEDPQGGVSTTSSPLSKKSLSSPAKPVSKPATKPVTPASKPVKPVSTTPSAPPKLSRGSSYRNYMNRSGPKAPGSKVVPEGEENCFEGLTFVITGVLESLEREAAADIIKRYGGKVTQSISKKTSYLVVGEESGESKLAKAVQLGTKQIDEDGLLELLRTCPGKKYGGTKKPPASPVVKSKGSLKGGKGKSASPPKTGEVTGSGVGTLLTTPNRHHVTTPVAMATPSPSTSSTVGTPARIATPKLEGSESLLWVDKYRPKSIKNIIGQQGDKSNAKKLLRWLQDWEKNRGKGGGGGKKGGGWGSSGQGDGAGFHAVLLSGPPGVGKTTTAVLACEETGYSYVELNASATRSKRTLHDEVATQLDCMSLDVFRTKSVGVASGRRHALIMDEVDGMAGNEDRGGVQEVISMIKNTKIPIICICNDRQHPKIRSLSNYCFDLRFYRPRVDQIRGAMMSVCYKEGVKMAPNALAEIIMASGQDIRQVLHNLSVWTATDKNLSYDDAKATAKSAKKESKLNPFDVIKLVFMPREGDRELSLAERFELFFHDYSLAPLFVQENYLSVKPLQAEGDIKHTLRLLSDAADSLSDGDLVERKIRGSSQWGLLPVQAVFSSVLPGQLMRGNFGRPEFPRWLGSNSTRGKNDRLLQDLQRHTRLTASCNKTEFGMDYLPFLHTRLTQPLLSEGSDGVSKVVSMMTTYDLGREDWDSIVELNQFPGQPNTVSNLPSKVKSAFTRTFNKEQHKVHYGADTVSKKSSHVTTYEEQDDSPDTEPESDSELSQDSMVKVKSKGTESKVTSKAGSNGGKGKGKASGGSSQQKKGVK